MAATSDPDRQIINWVVRPTTADDSEGASAVLKASYEALLPQHYDSNLLALALPMMTQARPELLESGTWYVVEHPEDATVVGCGGWSPQPPTSKNSGRPHLRHFATDPKITRQGVAKAIWNRIWEDVVTTMGADTELEVYSTITAQPFYQSIGFVPIESLNIPLSPECPFPVILMRRAAPTSNS